MPLVNECSKGVWNNCDFSKPAGDWSESARKFRGERGVVDLEWKLTGAPYHISNKERDMWLKKIQSHNLEFKLFLTYFKDYT